MITKSIYTATEDYVRLHHLARTLMSGKGPQAAAGAKLLHELDRSIMIAAHELPPGVVRINSQVTLEDAETGEVENYVLTLPENADPDQGRLSVLAPIGTAILGYAEGDEIAWTTPGGIRRLKLRSVSQPVLA